MNYTKSLTISIVSHGQFELLLPLLKNLEGCKEISKIILTINIPEIIKEPKWLKNLPIFWIFNSEIKGFGSNHNQAHKHCQSKYFLVLNPDIRINKDIISGFLELKDKYNVDILAPSIKNKKIKNAINSRKFPNLFFLFRILLRFPQKEYFYLKCEDLIYTDWVGGMFILITHEQYKKLGGFDTDFFLYFEDVDFCKRASYIGLKVAQSRKFYVTHFEQKLSHLKLKYFIYHIISFLIYIKKHFLNYN